VDDLFVDRGAERLGETPISQERRCGSAAPDLRFGDIKVAFKPSVEAGVAEKGTRAIAGVSVEEARRIAARKSVAAAPAAAPAAEPAAAPAGKGGVPGWVWAVVAVVIAAGAYFVFFRGS